MKLYYFDEGEGIYKAIDYPIAEPMPAKRRIRFEMYMVRDAIRTLTHLIAICIAGSVLFILLDIIVHGGVKW